MSPLALCMAKLTRGCMHFLVKLRLELALLNAVLRKDMNIPWKRQKLILFPVFLEPVKQL